MPNFPTTWLGLQRVPFNWALIKERNAATWYDHPPVTTVRVQSNVTSTTVTATTPIDAPAG